jgi:hypothetical protein
MATNAASDAGAEGTALAAKLAAAKTTTHVHIA